MPVSIYLTFDVDFDVKLRAQLIEGIANRSALLFPFLQGSLTYFSSEGKQKFHRTNRYPRRGFHHHLKKNYLKPPYFSYAAPVLSSQVWTSGFVPQTNSQDCCALMQPLYLTLRSRCSQSTGLGPLSFSSQTSPGLCQHAQLWLPTYSLTDSLYGGALN